MINKHSFTLLFCLTLAACAGGANDSKADGGWFGSKKEQPVKVAKIDEAKTHAWIDAYEPRLQAAIAGTHLQVQRRDNVLVVIAPVTNTFHPDRPNMLLPAVLGPFSRVAKAVGGDTATAVLILGHADSSGQAASNLTLSDERARAVAAIFRLTGLRGDRLITKGVGSDMPRAANDSSEGRELNRRVEVVLTPKPTLYALLAHYTTPAVVNSEVAQVAPEQKKTEKNR